MDSITAILAGVAAANIITLCTLCFYVARLSARVSALTRLTAESVGKLRADQEIMSAECLQRRDVHLLRAFLGLPTREDCKSFTREGATEKI